MKAKRIAIIIDTLNGGGAEKVCLSLFQGMQARQIDVHLVVLKKKCDYQLPSFDNIHFVFDNEKIRLTNYFVQKFAAKKLNKMLMTLGGFDAYISNLDVTNAIVGQAKLPNCFYVVHNSIEKSLATFRRLGPIRYWRKRQSITILNGKRLIAVSEGVKNEIVQGSIIKPLDVTTIYNPIDIDRIRESANQDDPDIPSQDYILFMGRVAKQKRVDILIQAFQHLESSVDLVVLSNNQKKLKKVIKQYNVHNKHIIGMPFKQNPYPLIKHAKALVLSSDYEGLGMVLIEALACGTPVASTDCPHGPNEILCDDMAQFLSPVGDPISLAHTIDLAILSQVKNPKFLEKVAVNNVINDYLSLIYGSEFKA